MRIRVIDKTNNELFSGYIHNFKSNEQFIIFNSYSNMYRIPIKNISKIEELKDMTCSTIIGSSKPKKYNTNKIGFL